MEAALWASAFVASATPRADCCHRRAARRSLTPYGPHRRRRPTADDVMPSARPTGAHVDRPRTRSQLLGQAAEASAPQQDMRVSADWAQRAGAAGLVTSGARP